MSEPTDPRPSEGKIKRSSLGRGLSSLIGEYEAVDRAAEDEAAAGAGRTGQTEIDIKRIHPNPSQPRRSFPEAELAELAESIRVRGVLQPILLRPDPRRTGDFQIVAGERRFRAAQRAGMTALPAVVRDLNDIQVLEIGIIENVQRQDLNAIEEAEAYNQLMVRFARSQDSLAESVGKSRAHIANTLRLLKLPEAARDLVRDGVITAGHARAALQAEQPMSVIEEVVAKGLSVRDTEKLARSKSAGQAAYETKSAPGQERDTDTHALEMDLSRKLGLDVEIRQSGRGGELRVRYKTLEQLDNLCAKLSRKN